MFVRTISNITMQMGDVPWENELSKMRVYTYSEICRLAAEELLKRESDTCNQCIQAVVFLFFSFFFNSRCTFMSSSSTIMQNICHQVSFQHWLSCTFNSMRPLQLKILISKSSHELPKLSSIVVKICRYISCIFLYIVHIKFLLLAYVYIQLSRQLLLSKIGFSN